MEIDDWVWVIAPDDKLYGHKCRIKAVHVNVEQRIIGYLLSDKSGICHDYKPEDLEYTNARKRRMNGQMQLL